MPNGQVLFQNFEDLTHAQAPLMGQYLMIDTAAAVDVGWWRPWPFKQGSMEVTGLTTGTLKLIGSNAKVMPANGFTITVGGSVANGNATSISIVSDSLPNGKVTGAYTATTGNTTGDVAAGLATALKNALAAIVPLGDDADQAIAAGQLQVSVAGSVVTVKCTNPDLFFKLTTTTSGSITMTNAQYDSGAGNDVASVTANGITQHTAVMRWFKVAVTALTTGTPTAIVEGYS